MTLADQIMAGSSAISAGVALWACWRMERWRKSDEWRGTQTRLGTAESDIGLLKHGLSALQGDVEGLPTKADIARVEGAISRVESEVQGAAAGVDRIEGMLMKRALDAAR